MPQGHEEFIAALCRCLEAVEGETEKIDVRREGGREGGREDEMVEKDLSGDGQRKSTITRVEMKRGGGGREGGREGRTPN